jgi:hypothetical protein
LCRYFKRGQLASFDHGELVDLLCVSNDLLGDAGFSPEQADEVLRDANEKPTSAPVERFLIVPTAFSAANAAIVHSAVLMSGPQ